MYAISTGSNSGFPNMRFIHEKNSCACSMFVCQSKPDARAFVLSDTSYLLACPKVPITHERYTSVALSCNLQWPLYRLYIIVSIHYPSFLFFGSAVATKPNRFFSPLVLPFSTLHPDFRQYPLCCYFIAVKCVVPAATSS
jgi:hypothetical protein